MKIWKYIGKIVMHSLHHIIIEKFWNNECYIKPYQMYKENKMYVKLKKNIKTQHYYEIKLK